MKDDTQYNPPLRFIPPRTRTVGELQRGDKIVVNGERATVTYIGPAIADEWRTVEYTFGEVRHGQYRIDTPVEVGE